LVAAGKLRLPKVRLDVKALLKIPTGSVAGNEAIQAVLADREEELEDLGRKPWFRSLSSTNWWSA
jgi:hypothetical protein